MVASRENFPLLAELLADQQRLQTPVAQFSSAHDAGISLQASRHASLIPLTAPLPGEQYAFEIDLDSCTGCKSCVAACHSLNGLDDDETWRDVGLIISAKRSQPFSQTVTTACHHCADPACLNGCPVLAYEKDPITGIVRHLDDQCIGCSYCILKCPYDVPKFSERLGIVRKCDMCHSRLAHGEAPACAQACPTQAIRIVTVPAAPVQTPAVTARQDSRKELSGFRIPVPEVDSVFSDPTYTGPTTRYVTRRTFPATLIAADATTLRPQPAHWPLVVMLTAIPVAVGLAGVANASRASNFAPGPNHLTFLSWLAGAIGLGASVFHLGQPLRAWRSFLGWRKSWLSREAIVLGAWFMAATLTLFLPAFARTSAALGVVGLGCSAMVYIDTRRHFWRAEQTVPRFFGTTLLVALAILAPMVAGLMLLAKMVWELRTLSDHSMSARLQLGPLSTTTTVRGLTGLLAVVWLVASPGWIAVALLVAGESAERVLFFRAVDAPKMPSQASTMPTPRDPRG